MNLPLFSNKVSIANQGLSQDSMPFDAPSIKNRILKFLIQKIQADLNTTGFIGLSKRRNRFPLPNDFKLAGMMVVEKDFNYVISNYSEEEKFLNCVINGTFSGIGEIIGEQIGLYARESFSIDLEGYSLYFEPYRGSYVGVIYTSNFPQALSSSLSVRLKMVFKNVFEDSESFKSEIYNDKSAEIIKTIFSECVPLVIT